MRLIVIAALLLAAPLAVRAECRIYPPSWSGSVDMVDLVNRPPAWDCSEIGPGGAKMCHRVFVTAPPRLADLSCDTDAEAETYRKANPMWEIQAMSTPLTMPINGIALTPVIAQPR